MEQCCPRVNHPSHTVAKFQASTQDPRDESSEKGFWREKQKQCRFKHERTNARNVASTAGKDLSYLTCFNSDKEVSYTTVSQAKEKQRHLRRLMTVLVISALKRLTWTVPRGYSRTSSLQSISGLIPEK